MKVTRKCLTKWACGISALAGICLVQGCGTSGPKGSAPVESEVVRPTKPFVVEEIAVQPVALPPVSISTPYTVAKGETLTGIARQYGLRWQDVVAVNPGLNPDKLRIGQVLQLPGQVELSTKRAAPRAAPAAAVKAEKTVTYKIVEGDSLSLIAYRFGVKVNALKAANNLTSDVIYAGKTLKIVNPTKSGAATTRTPSVKAPTVKAPAKPVATSSQTAPPVTVTPVKPSAPERREAVVDVPVAPVAPPPPAPANKLAPAAPAVPVAEAVADEPAFRNYTVQEGEDLFGVAIRWGVSPNEIKAMNGLAGNDLEAGKTIRIPFPAKQP